MLYFLEGAIVKLSTTYIVLNVNGLGIMALISLKTYEDIRNANQNIVRLYTHIHITNNNIVIYGFHALNESEVFKKLINIDGIGPKIAISILSSLNYDQIYNAIQTKDSESFSNIKGISSKLSQRIILELFGKLEINDDSIVDSQIYEESINALENLGINHKNAVKIVNDIYNDYKNTEIVLTTEFIIRKALSKN